MNASRLVGVISACAAVLGVSALGYASCGLAALRDEQATLARDVTALRRELADLAAAAPPPALAVTPLGATPPTTAPAPHAADPSDEFASAPPADMPAPTPLASAARDELLERYARLEGPARARALEDLEMFARFGDREARDAILDGLRDADAAIRERAVKSLGNLGDAALIAELTPLLEDPNPDVRKEVAQALESAPAEQAGPLLLQLLEDAHPDVVEEAIDQIGAHRYEPARRALAELATPDDPKLSGAIGEALRDIGDRHGAAEVVALLTDTLDHPDAEQRKRAVKSIGKIGGDAARNALERALEDPHPGVQREARKRLEKLDRG